MQSLRRLSSRISRDVRKFWLKINKVVAFKQKTDFDEIRQKAMDKHLVFLVKQTERYTNQLAENLLTGGEVGHSIGPRTGRRKGFKGKVRFSTSSAAPDESPHTQDGMDVTSVAGSRASSPRSASRSAGPSRSETSLLDGQDFSDLGDDETTEDEEEEFVADDEEDDETTMIEEEERGEGLAADEEVNLLKNESEIPI